MNSVNLSPKWTKITWLLILPIVFTTAYLNHGWLIFWFLVCYMVSMYFMVKGG